MAPNNKPKKPTMLQRQRQLRAQQQQVRRASSNQLPASGGSSGNSRQARAQRANTTRAQAANQQRIINRGTEGFIRRGIAQDKLDKAAQGTRGSGTRTAGAGGGLARRPSSAVTTTNRGTAKPPKPAALPPNQFRGWGNLNDPNSYPKDSGRPRGPSSEQRAADNSRSTSNRSSSSTGRGGAIEKAGPTIDVKASSVSSSSGGTRGSRPAAGGSPSAATRGGRARPGVGTPTSPINPNVQWGQSRPNSNRAGVNLPRAGAAQFRNTTADVRPANRPPTGGASATRPTAPTSSAKPPAKPSARPSLRGALRGAVGRGNALILGLSAANAAQESLMTPEQRNRKAEAAIRPLTMADMPGQGGGSRGVRTGTASGRTGRGGTTADVRAAAPAKPRVSNIPPAEGTGRGGPSDIKRTQPKPPTRSNGGNPPAPGSSRRQPSSGGGSSAPSRLSAPSPQRAAAPKPTEQSAPAKPKVTGPNIGPQASGDNYGESLKIGQQLSGNNDQPDMERRRAFLDAKDSMSGAKAVRNLQEKRKKRLAELNK